MAARIIADLIDSVPEHLLSSSTTSTHLDSFSIQTIPCIQKIIKKIKQDELQQDDISLIKFFQRRFELKKKIDNNYESLRKGHSTCNQEIDQTYYFLLIISFLWLANEFNNLSILNTAFKVCDKVNDIDIKEISFNACSTILNEYTN